ncbi:MAG: Smr/MutS family protein, partial [candidate division WOR-3 bacterium]|nr:Smr/MutS family protein [candidate division WOR-3 bacterium]
ILGSYGESSAFAVSKQLGLSDEILLRAEKYLDKDKLLLAKKLTELNKEIQRYQQLNNELESTKKTLDTVQKVWETNLVNIKEKINEEKQAILKLKQSLLLDSRKKIEQLIQEIKQTSADKQAIKKAKEYIQNELTTVNKELAELSPNSLVISNNFDVGDYVYSKTYKKTGLVLSINKKLYTVAFGNIKIDLPASDLIKVPAPAESACELKSEHFNVQKNFETVLNIRGLNKEEAIYLLGKFLDSAYYNNIKEVKIIHGKGKGILKEAIWEHLKDDPRIERFYLGDSFEGGQGVTKVVLKSQI